MVNPLPPTDALMLHCNQAGSAVARGGPSHAADRSPVPYPSHLNSPSTGRSNSRAIRNAASTEGE
jgi:hypothetical protein